MRWRTTISNHRPKVLRKMAQNPGIQMGFSDAGAHLRNMAFYNFGLRLLKHVVTAEKAGRPFLTVEQAVHRLTGELADWYGLDAGHLRVGDRADLFVLDPRHLDDSLEEYAEAPVEAYDGLSRMVNRNDRTVPLVMIGSRPDGGGTNAMPEKGGTVHMVYGPPIHLERKPWPRTQEQVRATSMLLHRKFLAHLDHAISLTGRALPGPITDLDPAEVKATRPVSLKEQLDD